MTAKRPDRGDIFMVYLDGAAGREMQGEPRPVLVLTPAAFNAMTGAPMCVPITQGGMHARDAGFAATLTGLGTKTQGAAITSQVRIVDLVARKGVFVEKAPETLMVDVLGRIANILDL